jgi:hypothetical protein
MVLLVIDDQEIPGYEMRIRCESPMPADDLSGQSSASLEAEKGHKPRTLRVSTKIRYQDKQQLHALVQLSTKLADGRRHVYTITNDTAAAFNIRQVRFSEKLAASEIDGEQAWAVDFVLREVLSVPEKVEAQQLQKNNGPADAPADAPAIEESSKPAESVSWFESNIVKPLNDYLAPEGGGREI